MKKTIMWGFIVGIVYYFFTYLLEYSMKPGCDGMCDLVRYVANLPSFVILENVNELITGIMFPPINGQRDMGSITFSLFNYVNLIIPILNGVIFSIVFLIIRKTVLSKTATQVSTK